MNATSNTRASVLAKGTWPSNVVSVLLSILLAVTLFPATALSQPAASAPQSPTGDVVMEGVTVTQLLDAQASASEDPAALVTVRAGEASADATFAGGALAAQEVIAQSTPALAEALGSADGAASAADFRPDVTLAEGADETVAQAVTSSAYEGAQLYRADSAAPVMGSDGQAVQVLAAATIDGSVLYAVRGSDAVMKLPAGSRIELGYEAPAADEVEETPEGGVLHLRK